MMLPCPKTRFVGRAEDLSKLASLCTRGAPLVTLWGPPGIGKTRLAIELCKTCAPRAWFCDLSGTRDVVDVCAATLRAIDLEPSAGASAPAFVGLALSGLGPGVLVLDNFEHLTRHAKETVGVWLDAAPHVSIVVTSRERTRLEGEVAHEVLPLPEAIALFRDRAPAWHTLDPEAIERLVERLEGIPMAIELAAARVEVLGVEGLLARLSQPADVLGLHGTLERAIDASFRLLTDVEQRTLAQCAVFRGGFTLEEAEAVVEAAPRVALLDVLQTLHDRSLLRCVSDGGSVRFQFFEAIRARAASALRTRADEFETRRKHALHFVARPHDVANLADAVAFVLSDPAMRRSYLDEAIAAIAGVEPAKLTDELVDQLECALAGANDSDPRLRACGHRARGRALLVRGKCSAARAELERALALAPADPAFVAELWVDVGLTHHQLRETEPARACYERALAHGETFSGPVARARCIGNLGALDHDVRRFDRALERYQEAIAMFRGAGEERLEGAFLTNMAVLLQETGASPRARATYALAVERLSRSNDRRLEAIAHTNLGLLCHELGELEEACACHEKALALLRSTTDGRSEGLCLGRLAMALAALGHSPEARVRLSRADRILRSVGDPVSLEVLDLFRAYVDYVSLGDTALTRERLTQARVSAGDVVPLVNRSDDARTTLRLLECKLARADGHGSVLVIGPDARWLIPPGGRTLDLSSRRVLRRLLWRLVENHRASPGEGLTLDDLRDAAWPGDRASPAAAANRIHVALTELRRRGLRSCLRRKESRYLIDPALRVELRER